MSEFEIKQTDISAYERLKHLHYITHGTPKGIRKVFGLYADGVLYGVIVYSNPNLESLGRNSSPLGAYLKTIHYSARYHALNQLVLVISRVIIHPSLRGIGAASHLIEQTWRLAGTKYVEIIAQMLYYHNFLPASCAYYTRVERMLGHHDLWPSNNRSPMAARLKTPLVRYGYGLFINTEYSPAEQR